MEWEGSSHRGDIISENKTFPFLRENPTAQNLLMKKISHVGYQCWQATSSNIFKQQS